MHQRRFRRRRDSEQKRTLQRKLSEWRFTEEFWYFCVSSAGGWVIDVLTRRQGTVHARQFKRKSVCS